MLSHLTTATHTAGGTQRGSLTNARHPRISEPYTSTQFPVLSSSLRGTRTGTPSFVLDLSFSLCN